MKPIKKLFLFSLLSLTFFLFCSFFTYAQACTPPQTGCLSDQTCVSGACQYGRCGDKVCNDCSNAFSPCFINEPATCPGDCPNITPQKPTCSAYFNPSTVAPGQPFTANWSSQGDADGKIPYSCTSGESGTLDQPYGSASFPGYPKTSTCTLTVENSAGKSTCSATLTVAKKDVVHLTAEATLKEVTGSTLTVQIGKITINWWDKLWQADVSSLAKAREGLVLAIPKNLIEKIVRDGKTASYGEIRSTDKINYLKGIYYSDDSYKFTELSLMAGAETKCTPPAQGCGGTDQWSCVSGECKAATCGDGVCNDCSAAFSPCTPKETPENCSQDCKGSTIVPFGTDTDGGKNFQVRGKATGYKAFWEKKPENIATEEDFCTSVCSGNIGSGRASTGPCLVEFYIDSDKYANYEPVACENGCENGACKNTCGTVPVCGDGKLDAGEECDDGNTKSGDGCSSGCKKSDLPGTTFLSDHQVLSFVSIPPLQYHYYKMVASPADAGKTFLVTLASRDYTTKQDMIIRKNTPVSKNDFDLIVNSGGLPLMKQGPEYWYYITGGIRYRSVIYKIPVAPGDTYYIIVVNRSNETGSYTIFYGSVLRSNAVCGNGKLETGEECDDGNIKSGDGCSAICKTEPSGIITLQDGVGIRNESITAKGTKYFKFVIPQGKNNAQIRMGTMDWATNQDMVIGTYVPTTNDYEQGEGATKSGPPIWYNIYPNSSNESIRMTKVQHGTYYIMIYNTSNSTGKFELIYSSY